MRAPASSSSPTTRRARCQKISEIYDRIAFAAVGKYNEFQLLRIAGVRHADLKGYSYSREDVSAKELANAYAQTLGQIFTHEMKPYEVELLVAEVGRRRRRRRRDVPRPLRRRRDGRAALLRARRLTPKPITEALEGAVHRRAWTSATAVKLGAKVLGTDGEPLGAEQLEVALLDRARPRRAFRRIKNAELEGILAS